MKKLLLSFGLLASFSLGAQDLRMHIPSDVTYLFSWNAGRVSEKVNTRQLMQQESFDLAFQQMVQGLDSIQQEEFYTLWTNPEAYGINSRESVHFFGRNDDSGHYYAFLVPLNDPALLEGFVARLAELTREPITIESQEGFRMSRMGGYFLAWNQSVAVIAGGKASDLYGGWEEWPYEEEYEYEEYEEIEEVPAEEEVVEEYYEEEEWEEEVPEEVVSWIAELLNRSFPSSLLMHPEYQIATAEPADAHIWADYQQLMQLSQGGMGGMVPGSMAGLGAASQMLNDLYNGVFYSVALNFEKGELEMKSAMLGNGRMVEVMKDAYKSKFNRKMWKYVDSRFLLGYYTIQVNVEALAEGMKGILYDVMASDPLYGETAVRMMDVLGIVVDDKALYELFKGDIFVAMTGLRQAEIPVFSYEYDMDFNASEVEKVIRKQYPEFLVMISYGNEENMLKLIRLGESSNIFLNMGAYYQVMGNDESETYYLAMKDGILFFTNDGGLIEGKLDSGVDKAARLNKTHRKNLRKHVQAMHWDVQATWEAMQQAEGTDLDPELAKVMEGIQEKVSSVSLLTSRKVKPSIHGKMAISLTDRESNALEQVVGLLNQLILEAAGLERI